MSPARTCSRDREEPGVYDTVEQLEDLIASLPIKLAPAKRAFGLYRTSGALAYAVLRDSELAYLLSSALFDCGWRTDASRVRRRAAVGRWRRSSAVAA